MYFIVNIMLIIIIHIIYPYIISIHLIFPSYRLPFVEISPPLCAVMVYMFFCNSIYCMK